MRKSDRSREESNRWIIFVESLRDSNRVIKVSKLRDIEQTINETRSKIRFNFRRPRELADWKLAVQGAKSMTGRERRKNWRGFGQLEEERAAGTGAHAMFDRSTFRRSCSRD